MYSFKLVLTGKIVMLRLEWRPMVKVSGNVEVRRIFYRILYVLRLTYSTDIMWTRGVFSVDSWNHLHWFLCRSCHHGVVIPDSQMYLDLRSKLLFRSLSGDKDHETDFYRRRRSVDKIHDEEGTNNDVTRCSYKQENIKWHKIL